MSTEKQPGRRARTKEEEKLEALLRSWGREYYGEDYREQQTRRHWETRTAAHPISTFFGAGRKVKRATKTLVGRGGYERRRTMGAAAGRVTKDGKVLPVPMWSSDPIPCKERRKGRGGAAVDRSIPPVLSKVEQAVKRLESVNLVRALCVRVQYADEIDQQHKYERVNEHMRRYQKDFKGIDLAQFRDQLTFARVWLHGALAELLAEAA